jgi:hypothetical protein
MLTDNIESDTQYAIAFSDGCNFLMTEIKRYRLKHEHWTKERKVIDNLIRHLEKDNVKQTTKTK